MKKEKYKLSIIIPNYNSGKDLLRCVQSIMKLSIPSIEIIVVDDGSTDQSMVLLQTFVNNTCDKNYFEFMYVNHVGAGAARNEGIKHANGIYVMFVDADDELLTNDAISGWLKLKRNSEIVVFSKSINKLELGYENKRNLTVSNLGLSKNNIYDSGPCSKLFSMQMLIRNKIKFPNEVIVGEDMIFNILALQNAKNVDLINQGIYQVNTNSNSITHSMTTKGIEKNFQMLIYHVQLILEGTKEQDLISLFSLKNYLMLIVKLAKSDLKISECINLLHRNRSYLLKSKAVTHIKLTELFKTMQISHLIIIIAMWYISPLTPFLMKVLRRKLRNKPENTKNYI